ncbi:hypothetical protein [Flavobacterium solisilvae]|uniref:Lipocalin-like domain-containing protein n=1 Tax=Flavobacterium solisilvae TaxID=1852019 RepID=A0ABX1QRR7_9FLAO|nr:hypothetical protein [Flavobacterium solisilvae]NMH24358.1 hypothetical protein [Flavobacterium solisilvae]
MKNIFLLFFTVTTILSCSNSDTNENTTIPAELIGTWQFKGIYSFDVVDENDMPLYTAYENGGFITFYENKNFKQIIDNLEYTGMFSVNNANKLILTYDPNQIGLSTEPGNSKIYFLSENVLKLSCFDDGLCDIIRYEKIEPN